MTFKDKMRNELINAGKRADDKGMLSIYLDLPLI